MTKNFPDAYDASMSFDPYYHWLGIPPFKQPPNHYCLLGIELFESSPTVIENAADQRMGHLRRHQTGPHSLQSQELLNKVATAKICLLQPEKKAEYDATLKEHLSADTTDRGNDSGGSFPHTLYDFVSTSDYGNYAKTRRNQVRRRSRVRRMIILNMFGFSVIAITAIGLQPNNPLGQYLPKQMSTNQTVKPLAPAHSSKPPKAISMPPTASKQTSPNSVPSLRSIIVGTDIPQMQSTPLANQGSFAVPSTGQKDLSVSSPAISMDILSKTEVSPEAVPKPEVVTKSSKTARDNRILPSPPTTKEAPPKTLKSIPVKPPQRLPVPSQAAQQKALAELQEVCDTTTLMKPIDKIRRAEEWIDLSKKVSKTAERFVLLRRAAEIAGEAGDIRQMVEAIDMLTAQYDLDGWSIKQKLLGRLLSNADTEQMGPLIRGTRLVIDQAVAAKCYCTAIALSELALSASQQLPSRELRREIQDRLLQIQRSEKQQRRIEEAEAVLLRDPANADANLILGRWHCLDKNDWEKGLPFLAKGSDEELRLLSQRELHSPLTPEEKIKLGDAWWRSAQDRPKEDKEAFMLRAGHWYECCKELDFGIAKTRVAKRLKEISRIHRSVNATFEEQATVSQDAARHLWTDIL